MCCSDRASASARREGSRAFPTRETPPLPPPSPQRRRAESFAQPGEVGKQIRPVDERMARASESAESFADARVTPCRCCWFLATEAACPLEWAGRGNERAGACGEVLPSFATGRRPTF